jgi:hypothetical protein
LEEENNRPISCLAMAIVIALVAALLAYVFTHGLGSFLEKI